MALYWRKGAAIVSLCVALLVLYVLFNRSALTVEENGEDAPYSDRLQYAHHAKYPSSLTYWVAMNPEESAVLKSYNEMGMYKELERITGTKVQFQHHTFEQQTDQFNLTMLMASRTLPDVIDSNWSMAQPDKLIRDGKIIRLNELIDQYAPNLSKLLNKKPDIRKLITSDEGNIYAFPTIADDPSLSVFNGLIIRKDWLDKLGLQPPTTIEEWEHMLIAFRDEDPNGNGIQDEIPLMYNKDTFFISYAFAGAFGITTEFYHENGTVKYGPYEPQFKEYLALLNKWYTEGLIDKDYLTTDTNVMDAKVRNNQVGAFNGWVASSIGKYSVMMKDKHPEFELMGVVFPKLGSKDQVIAKKQNKYEGFGAAISANAPNPEKIVAWLDYGYSQEGHILFNFGIEGESYTMVNDKPVFTDLILRNPDHLPVSQALAKYTRMGSAAPFEYSAEGYSQYNALPEQIEAKENWLKADHNQLLPNLSLRLEEQMQEAAIMKDLLRYQDEMLNKFIMGIEPLDKFEEYIHTLQKLGIEEEIQIKQAAFDRFTQK